MELLNHVIDRRAHETPEMLYAEISRSPSSFNEGFRQITYSAFANAINGVAWWLHEHLGTGASFETLVYLGPSDVRYNILLFGAVKAGYKMLFTSPRYSTVAQINLIKSVACKTLLAPEPRPPVTNAILETCELQVLKVPTIEDLFDSDFAHYPYEKNFENARHEPLVVLHTSGTTGLPKPIIWTHDWAASFGQERRLHPPLGSESSDGLLYGNRILSLMPPFHASNLFASVMLPIFCTTSVIYPLSGVPPSVQAAAGCLEQLKIDAMTLTPPHIEEIAGNPELLHYLSQKLQTLFWAGGDVASTAGDTISRKIRLFTANGSTEMGMWPTLHPSGDWPYEHWKYMHVHPSMRLDFRHRSDNLYEACIMRSTRPEEEQPVFKIFPGIQEFKCGDLFSPHPTEPQLWKYHGRVDDLLIFASGEVFHPASVEKHISQHPDVEGVLLVGTRRPQAALIVAMNTGETVESTDGQSTAIRKLWPTIEESNQICPTYARITTEHILFARSQKPMVKTGKGAIQRAATISLYDEELDHLFARAAASSAPTAESA
ncbi:abhydrolase domain-containing protein mpaH [Physcia stellaris]|nr:abhydrolase domain-containing protein mpaH [Physcia stellaris]